MNVFVTGCAGFIGSHLCEFLFKKGHHVVGLDNLSLFYDPEIKKHNINQIKNTAKKYKKEFGFYKGDIREADDIGFIIDKHKPKAIIHLAALAGVRPSMEDPIEFVDVNERGTVTLLEEAKKAGVKNIIFGSSSSVYGNNKKVPFAESDPVDNPVSVYAATKKAGELYCHIYHKAFQINIACLRFFTVYGPRQRPDLAIHKFAKLMLKGAKLPIYGDGTKSRDFTYINDIIDGIYLALNQVTQAKKPFYEIFNLGESETTDVNTLIKYLENALDKKADKDFLDEFAGDVLTTFADISKSKKILGYNPQTKIEDGINKFATWITS